MTAQESDLRIAGLLERIDELEAALAVSQTTNAALRREMADLRNEMAEVAVEVARQVEALPSTTSNDVTAVETPRLRSRRMSRETIQLPPTETMRDVVDGELWKSG